MTSHGLGANDATRYEVAAIHTDGRRFLVGYTARKSLQGLLAVVQSNGSKVCDLIELGATDEADIARSAGGKISFKNWTVRFSGRTVKDARNEGELLVI